MENKFNKLTRNLLLSLILSISSQLIASELNLSNIDPMEIRLTTWVENQDATLRYTYRAQSFAYNSACGDFGGVEIIFSSNYGLQKFLSAISDWAYFLRKLDFEDVFCVKRTTDKEFMIVNVDGWILGEISYEDPI
ncbi:MAG: hypothetical protein KBD78_12775 [Oligoflexales bacterium]|nr:hypothetical protein [Oligoflexales bacterium]